MPASDKHPDYDWLAWEKVRDCVDGAEAIKSRAGGIGASGGMWSVPGTRYLPPPNANDTSEDNVNRYIAYRERALFVNYTSATLDGMLGMVFREDTKIKLPANVEFIIENADGSGLYLEQMIKLSVSEVIQLGRFGLFVDHPPMQEGATKKQVSESGASGYIAPYTAENIINWRVESIEGKKELVMVVLAEAVNKYSEDGFSFEQVIHHRVLLLVDGIYIQQIYDEDDKIIIDEFSDEFGNRIPRKSNGSTWSEIPFVFIGSKNNDSDVDKAPLQDIADVNIGHYRNSADYEESSFLVGQPTPVFAGLNQAWAEKFFKNGIQIGSRSGVLLPEGGSGSLLQASPNQMPLEGMDAKQKQLVNLGARIIQDSAGVETAEAAKIRFAGQNSKLSNIIGNVESAFVQACHWLMEYEGGVGGEVIIEINRKFYDADVDPQLLIAQIQLLDRSVIAKSDLRDNLRRVNIIDNERTDDEIDSEASNVDPLV